MTTQVLSQLPDSARLWIYQADSPFREEDLPALRAKLQNFIQQWTSHNQQLAAAVDVLHCRFIVLAVDESQASASGCSIDKSVAFLQSLQEEYRTNLFNRLIFSYQDGSEVKSVHKDEFARLYAQGHIHDDTPVFDPLVATKADFDKGFVKPLGQSWHKRMV